MRLIDFGKASASPVDRYESRHAAFARIASTGGPGQLGCMYLGPSGTLGRHPTGRAQLFCVVRGEGVVTGQDGQAIPIKAGQAALWEPGEWHESTSEHGMVVLVLEVENASDPPATDETA